MTNNIVNITDARTGAVVEQVRVVSADSVEALVQRTQVLCVQLRDHVAAAARYYSIWVALSADLAAIYAQARRLYESNDRAFGRYLDESGLNGYNSDDRAALVAFGSDIERFKRACALSDQRRSYQHLYRNEWTQAVPSVPEIVPTSRQVTEDVPLGGAAENPAQPPETAGDSSSNPETENATPARRPAVIGSQLERGMGGMGQRLRARFLNDRGEQGDTFYILHKVLGKTGGRRALMELLTLMEENPHWEPTKNSKVLSLRTLHRDPRFFNAPGTAAVRYENDAVTPNNLRKMIRVARDLLRRGYGLPEGALPPVDPRPAQGSTLRVRSPEDIAAERAQLLALLPETRSRPNGDCPESGPWQPPERPRYTPSADEAITINGVVVREAGIRPNLYHYEWRTLQFLPVLFGPILARRDGPEAYSSAVDEVRLMFCGYLQDLGLVELAAALRQALTLVRDRPSETGSLDIRKAGAVLR